MMVARTVEGVLGVALRHHEGHVGVHAEGAGVVDHHGAVLGDGLGEFLGSGGAGRHEGVVHALEVVVVLEKLHFIFLPAEGVFAAGAPGRAEEYEFVNGEIAFVEDPQELLSHGSACTYDSYFHNLLDF